MKNDGGRANEPTSYGLRPPAPNGAQLPQQHDPATGGTAAAHTGQGDPAQEPADHAPTQVAPAQPPEDIGAGRILGGRYRLVGRLGHGGMGTVWRAHDEIVDRDVAVKEPRVPDHVPARERDTVYLRMQREARAAARIDHPSVVTMHDVVVEGSAPGGPAERAGRAERGGKPWIVMELVHGHSLRDRLAEGTLDVREAARIGLAILGALSAAHEAGVLHRDVKPDNVLLGRGGRVVLTDFGIAQVEGEQGLTETGAFVGSPEFISPERVLGQRPGPESDLWSLGVVLYAAVEGMSPFRRSNTPATLQAVMSAEPQMPARGSGAFGTLVMQLLRKNPADRPDTAEIRQVLESVARPAPKAVPQLTAPGPAGAPTATNIWVPPVLHRNRRAQYGLGAGVLAVAVALVLIFAQPFGGGGLPDGWLVRPESEVLKADVAVPKDYRRVQGDSDEASVTYWDPSGVFSVFVDRVDTAAADPGVKVIGSDPAEWKKHYLSGGDNGSEIVKAKVTVKTTSHQGQQASEIVTDYVDPADSSESPVVHRFHELLVPQDGGKAKSTVYWRMRVQGPARGWAAKTGDTLFSDVAAHLRIDGF
ncbi:serine/threonine-protein kinase [Streptomyces sp. NBC_00344]|uniref:serine/threonine-protein kinase n=1 Tax=Streptomyces sp. NBC_00344 TaxID=2975720 RepID=UPI002E1D7053